MRITIGKKLLISTLVMLGFVLVMSVVSIISIALVNKEMGRIVEISSFTKDIHNLRLSFERVLMPPHDYLIHSREAEYLSLKDSLKNLEENLEKVKQGISAFEVNVAKEAKGLFKKKKESAEEIKRLGEIKEALKKTRYGIDEIERLANEIFSIKDSPGKERMREMDIKTEELKRDIKGLMDILSKDKNPRMLEHLHEFTKSFQDILMPPHDYLILGEEHQRYQFDSIYSSLNDRLEKMGKIAGDVAEKGIVQKMREDFERVVGLGRLILDIKDPLKTEGAKKMEEMDVESDKVIRLLKEMLDFFEERVDKAKNKVDKTRKMAILIIVIGGIILVIGGLFGGILFTGMITRPVKQLLQATQRISAGDLTHKAQISTADEIGELAKSFNSMTEDLERYQQELIHAKEYIDNIIKSMIDTLIVINPDSTIHTVNQAALRLLNYEKQEDLVGKSIDTICTKGVDFFKGKKLEKLIKEGSVRNYNTVYKTRDGVEIPINLSASVMCDNDGNLIGTVCVGRDMREINSLINNLKKTYKDLQSTQAQLIQSSRLASMGTLAAGVAHEINNPMNVIINYAGLLEDEISPDAGFDTIHYIEGILKEGQRIVNIVKNLLAFARTDKQDHSTCKIAEIIDASIDFMDSYLARDGIRIETSYEPDLPIIKGKASQLEQVFINLIINARDALNEKYPKPNPDKLISIQVTPYTEEGIEYIRIIFTDNGIGIFDDNIDKVFDPFFTTKKVGKGTGLGLSITYGIIADHKGKITVKSERFKQTTFIIDLPTLDSWSKLEA